MPSAHQFAAAAEALSGVRWRMHGRDPIVGLDCGGLVVVALRAVGVTPTDCSGYDAHMPDPKMLWRLCRQNGTEQQPSDAGEGRVALCSWGSINEPRHMAVMLSDNRIIHVLADARRAAISHSQWLSGRLISVFRMNQVVYGAPWPQ